MTDTFHFENLLREDADVANMYRATYKRELVFLSPDRFDNPSGPLAYRLIKTVDGQISYFRKIFGVQDKIQFCVAISPRKSDGIGYVQQDLPCVMGPFNFGYVIVIPALYTDLMRIFFLGVCASPAMKALGLEHYKLFGTAEYQADNPPDTSKKDGGGRPIIFDAVSNIATSPDAMACADFLHVQAIRALVFHEFAHVLHGHLRLKGGGSIAMIDQSELASERIAIARALEFDADSFCCFMTFREIQTLVGKGFHFHQGEPYAGSYVIKDFQHASLMASIVLYGLFRFMGNTPISDDRWNTSHFPSLLRAMISLIQISNEIGRLGKAMEPQDFVDSIFQPTISAIESGYKQFNREHKVPPEWSGFQDIFSGYMKRISPAWNSIRDDLERLKLGGTINPPHPI